MAINLQEGSKEEWFRSIKYALHHPDRMKAANDEPSDRGLNGSDTTRKEKSVPAFPAPDLSVFLCCPTFTLFSFLFFFLSFVFMRYIPQSIWLMLTHPITYELPQIDPVLGMNPCGKIAATIDDVNTAIHGMTYHQYVNLGEFSLSSTWKRCVHS